MEIKLKTISPAGFSEALSKAQLYRYLNEPEEAESICQDVLSVDPENQAALRALGLAITDQFSGQPGDRYAEAETIFGQLTEEYERMYYAGLASERRAKALLQTGRAEAVVRPLLERAMSLFDQAEKIRPAENDDAILRWNRCARILEGFAAPRDEEEFEFEATDSPPVAGPAARPRTKS